MAGEHVCITTHTCKKKNDLLDLITCNKKNISLVSKGIFLFSVMIDRDSWSSETRIHSSRGPLLSHQLAGEAPIFPRPRFRADVH